MNDEAHCADDNNAGLPANALAEVVATGGRHWGLKTGGGGMRGLKPGGGTFVLIVGGGTFTLADKGGGTLTLTGSGGTLALICQDEGRNSPPILLLREGWNCATGAKGILCGKPSN